MATTVILGSGIIGLSTAFYLADHQPGSTIHLVDSSSGLFASASGYAGGFVAKDWFQASVASLGELSFQEHKRLSEREDGREKWGYSRSVTVTYEPGELRPARKGDEDWLLDGTSRADLVREREKDTGPRGVPRWLRRSKGDVVDVMDNGDGTAIVDPLKLCQFLLEKCKAAGVHLHHPATALSTTTDVRGELASVRIGYTDSSTQREVPASRLLFAAGAWTPQVFKSLFRDSQTDIAVAALAGHSLVVKMPEETRDDVCHSVYCSLGPLSPEVYSRTNGVIYLAGVNSPAMPLPACAQGAAKVEASIDKLKDVARQLISSKPGEDLEVVRTGLCFRPVTGRGSPIIGRLDDAQLGQGIGTRAGAEGGVFVAAGHGPWGISLSLGTGKVMAEMMQGRELSADVSRLGMGG